MGYPQSGGSYMLQFNYMRFTKDSLILVSILVGVIALATPALARPAPAPLAPITTTTSVPSTSASDTTSTITTTTTVVPPSPVPPVIAAQPSAVLNNLAAQLDSMLRQLVALLTVQLQGLQAQLAVKQGQVVAPPPIAATTTAQTAAPPTVATTANNPPRVNIVYPYSGLELTASASTDVVASALDEDGAISKVEFFEGTNSLGAHTGSKSPWSVRWSGISAGIYTLTAKATDDKGGQTTSAPVTLTVKALSEGTTGFTDEPPVITIATTITGTALTATATVTTYAGSISQVVWSRAASASSDAAYVTDVASPFNGNVALPVGQHTISAIATNSQGSQTRSASTTVTTN